MTKFLLLSIALHSAILFLPISATPPKNSPIKIVFTSEIISSPEPSSPPSYSYTIPLSYSKENLSSLHKLSLPIPSVKYNPSSYSPSFDYFPSFSTERVVKFSYPEVGGSEDKNKYFQIIKRRIEEVKFYPKKSIRRGEEGIVMVKFSIDSKGKVLNLHVIKSSGIKRLDKAGIEIIKRGAPFPPPPKGKKILLNVPIRFLLNKD